MLQRFGENLPEREVKFAPVDLKQVEAPDAVALVSANDFPPLPLQTHSLSDAIGD